MPPPFSFKDTMTRLIFLLPFIAALAAASPLKPEFGTDPEAILSYFKNREAAFKPVKPSPNDLKIAADALAHRFYAHNGYQPSFDYGQDIDWRHWPVKDNELRWQLHRLKWWLPMLKTYRQTLDETWFREWQAQYIDWLAKNPRSDLENARYAWRALETSDRLALHTELLPYAIASPAFDAPFLTLYLETLQAHADHLRAHYSKQGNHRLFEACRILIAGTRLPEFKDAPQWRSEGIAILTEEIEKQVYPDGFQFELDPHYHLAAIELFLQPLQNGADLPESYRQAVWNMIRATLDITFPDHTQPLFSDAGAIGKNQISKHCKAWLTLFPDSPTLRHFATRGKEGAPPPHTSAAHKDSGFYIFRSGWAPHSTVMILKAGPPAFWHNQPDNGTFELYINGRNFFPDSGRYVYGGDENILAQRAWFRQTRVHQTLTLANANLHATQSTCLFWDNTLLITENPSYPGLKHRRTVHFIDQTFFVLIDEALGPATGPVELHFQLAQGAPALDLHANTAATAYPDGNNIALAAFSPTHTIRMIEEEGWVSHAYMEKAPRPAFAFTADKTTEAPLRFITVITPFSGQTPPAIRVNGPQIEIHGKPYTLPTPKP